MSEKALTGASFYEFLSEHKFMGSRCTHCGAVYAPPRPLCPACPEEELEWVELSGQGTLASYSIIDIAPTMMLEAGYGRDNPYCSGVVELEEGPRISAQILGLDLQAPEKIEIGGALQVTFVERGPDEAKKTYLAFEPLV